MRLAEIFDISLDELFGRETPNLTSAGSGVELGILKRVRKLNETQKYALLQFLKEISNE